MKRVNVNLIVKRADSEPNVLYFEQLTDAEQNERLRAALVAYLKEGELTAQAFESWVKQSFSRVGEPAEVERLEYPALYYDRAGFRVPYTFLLDANHNEAMVWKWEARVFRGSLEELTAWLTRTSKAKAD